MFEEQEPNRPIRSCLKMSLNLGYGLHGDQQVSTSVKKSIKITEPSTELEAIIPSGKDLNKAALKPKARFSQGSRLLGLNSDAWGDKKQVYYFLKDLRAWSPQTKKSQDNRSSVRLSSVSSIRSSVKSSFNYSADQNRIRDKDSILLSHRSIFMPISNTHIRSSLAEPKKNPSKEELFSSMKTRLSLMPKIEEVSRTSRKSVRIKQWPYKDTAMKGNSIKNDKLPSFFLRGKRPHGSNDPNQDQPKPDFERPSLNAQSYLNKTFDENLLKKALHNETFKFDKRWSRFRVDQKFNGQDSDEINSPSNHQIHKTVGYPKNFDNISNFPIKQQASQGDNWSLSSVQDKNLRKQVIHDQINDFETDMTSQNRISKVNDKSGSKICARKSTHRFSGSVVADSRRPSTRIASAQIRESIAPSSYKFWGCAQGQRLLQMLQ
jgi:hypothetical protein